jgi:putative addiction module antidote
MSSDNRLGSIWSVRSKSTKDSCFIRLNGVITFVITSFKGTLMTKQTTIRAIGNSAGTTIPKPMLERYQLAEGDSVHLVETDEGILITPFDPVFDEAMEIYAEGAKRYRNAMRELAK